jgi:hypothetical protein
MTRERELMMIGLLAFLCLGFAWAADDGLFAALRGHSMVVAAIKEKGVLSGKRVERRESGAPCQAVGCEAWRRSRRST